MGEVRAEFAVGTETLTAGKAGAAQRSSTGLKWERAFIIVSLTFSEHNSAEQDLVSWQAQDARLPLPEGRMHAAAA
jgi:hypothetical protein